MQHLPVILIELLLIFGGALAFGWWQLRDLDREKRSRRTTEAQRALNTSPLERACASVPSGGSDPDGVQHERNRD